MDEVLDCVKGAVEEGFAPSCHDVAMRTHIQPDTCFRQWFAIAVTKGDVGAAGLAQIDFAGKIACLTGVFGHV
jgi:hypothetical protein